MLCSKCNAWETLTEDQFCSWCGTDLLGLSLSLDRSRLFIGDGVQTVTLTIEYTGREDGVEINGIESSRQWLKVKGNEAVGERLESGGRITVPLEVNALAQSEGYHSAEITVVTDIATRRARVEVNPRPEIVEPEIEATLLLTPSSRAKLAGHIEVRLGGVTVKEMKTSVDWAEVEPSVRSALPCRIDARGNSQLDFQIVIEEDWLLRDIENSGKQTPAEYRGNLIVEYAELEPPRPYPFYVTCMLPPELLIDEGEQIEKELFLGREGEVVLNISNGGRGERGRADLEIRDIVANVKWLHLPQAKFPMKLQSGRSVKLAFAANTNEAGERNHDVEITIFTNILGGESEKKVRVNIDVREMGKFGRSVAIDFGTTNSCCAAMDEFGRPDLMNLDPALVDYHIEGMESPQVASSAIIYWDLLDEEVKRYEIGKEAYGRAHFPQYEPSIVTQIKRRLGEEEKRPVTFYHNHSRQYYTPREIASDIVHRILERAESQLEGKIVECTISHPSRFSIRQINDIKATLTSRGIEETAITTIHEPVAAALGFIQEKKILDKFREYHLMVFDFGGGTTDITLLHVKNECVKDDPDPSKRRYTVTPKLLGATGDRWLGGEDVTDMVMELALDKCQKLLKSRYPDAGKILIPFDSSSLTDSRQKNVAVRNRTLLRPWAELSKIAISSFGDEHLQILERRDERSQSFLQLSAGFSLDIFIDSKLKQGESFLHADGVPQKADLDEKLRPRLEDVVEMMKNLAENNGVDAPNIILLAGGSSALPIVKEVIGKKFPEPKTEIKWPRDRKKCVAIGACYMFSSDPSGSVHINFQKNGSLEATTSRLGIRIREWDQAKFKEIVPAGVSVPQKKTLDDLPPLERRYKLTILENTGLKDDSIIDGKPNRNIRQLKEFRLEQKLTEWEQAHGEKISDEALSQAQIEFEVTSNLTVRLIARIPEIEEPIEFEAVEVPGF